MNSTQLTHKFHTLLWDAAWLWNEHNYNEQPAIQTAYRTGALARFLHTDHKTLQRRLKRLETTGRVARSQINDPLILNHTTVSPYILQLKVINPKFFSDWHRIYPACRHCARTTIQHESEGLCRTCYKTAVTPISTIRQREERKKVREQKRLTPKRKPVDKDVVYDLFF